MASNLDDGHGVSRRKILECMTWAGAGVLWTIAGGVPRSIGIIGEAAAVEPSGLTFLQISDSHVGFDKPANPNAIGTLEEALSKINALAVKPSFLIHTGDITHLSKPSEFDDADRIISQARLDVHYVPGEHDVLDEDVKLYRDRFGSVTVLNGHIHQIMQKVEGNVTFHTAMSTAFPQPAPGTAPSPGPLKVADDKLRSVLGITDVTFKRGQQRLAIIDEPLQR